MKIFLSETLLPLGGGVGGGALRVTRHASRFIELLSSNPGAPLPGERIIEYKSPGKLKKVFRAFRQNEHQMKLILWSEMKDDSLRTNFFHMFTNINAAGGLVKNERGERLFIFRLGKWDLPKGKLSGKESAEEAAIREVKEETGLQDVKIKGQLPSTWHIYSRKGKQILKQTYWFEMETNSNQSLIPQTEEDISDVRWFKKDELGIVLENTYGSIREILMRDT